MLQCPNCQKTQEVGKFCGECGTQVVEMEQPEQMESPIEKQPSMEFHEEVANQGRQENNSIHTEEAATAEPIMEAPGAPSPVTGAEVHGGSNQKADIKEEATKFWNTALVFLKNPVHAFEQTEAGFLFGIIQILLYPATFALAIYLSVNSFLKSSIGFMLGDSGIPFFSTFIYGFFLFLMLLGVSFLSIVIVEKVLIKQLSIKTMVAQYGALITPFIFVHILAIVTGVAGSILLTAGLLGLSFILASFMMAPLFIYEKLSYYRTNNQKVYSSIGVFLTNGLLTYLVVRIIITELMADFLEELSYFMDFLI